MFEDLTDDNFQLFAMKSYANPNCTDLLEFHDDLKRIRYIKRLFKKYRETDELKERLILNHLLVLYNMFEARGMTRILFLKLEEHLDYLKPFLMFLNYYPVELGLIKGKRVLDNEIPLDDGIIKILRTI
jgi:hypothetical protein